jgi:Uncharacterized conserved protein
MRIKLTSIMVDDQDKAERFYTGTFGFTKKHDIPVGEGLRWLTVVSPDGPGDLELSLEPNANPAAKTFQEAMFKQKIPLAAFEVADIRKEFDRFEKRRCGVYPGPDSGRTGYDRSLLGHLRQSHPVVSAAGALSLRILKVQKVDVRDQGSKVVVLGPISSPCFMKTNRLAESPSYNPPMLPKADLRDYLAAERTFLAWIRTGLALMGFGFVVARFGLFLQQIQLVDRAVATQSPGLSLWFGTALIAAGVIVNLGSAWRHVQLVGQLDRGDAGSRSLSYAVATALFLALVGIAMAVYLLSVRNSANLHSANSGGITMAPAKDNGIVILSSPHSVNETVEKLKDILQSKGVTLFALVDHSGEAEKAGLKMANTKLLIFGSPRAGTPVMQATPSAALDLPLKILVAEDPQGKAWISYNSPQYLQQRHSLSPELLQNLSAVETLASKAVE